MRPQIAEVDLRLIPRFLRRFSRYPRVVRPVYDVALVIVFEWLAAYYCFSPSMDFDSQIIPRGSWIGYQFVCCLQPRYSLPCFQSFSLFDFSCFDTGTCTGNHLLLVFPSPFMCSPSPPILPVNNISRVTHPRTQQQILVLRRDISRGPCWEYLLHRRSLLRDRLGA